jgi:hypothetical protein
VAGEAFVRAVPGHLQNDPEIAYLPKKPAQTFFTNEEINTT